MNKVFQTLAEKSRWPSRTPWFPFMWKLTSGITLHPLHSQTSFLYNSKIHCIHQYSSHSRGNSHIPFTPKSDRFISRYMGFGRGLILGPFSWSITALTAFISGSWLSVSLYRILDWSAQFNVIGSDWTYRIDTHIWDTQFFSGCDGSISEHDESELISFMISNLAFIKPTLVVLDDSPESLSAYLSMALNSTKGNLRRRKLEWWRDLGHTNDSVLVSFGILVCSSSVRNIRSIV